MGIGRIAKVEISRIRCVEVLVDIEEKKGGDVLSGSGDKEFVVGDDEYDDEASYHEDASDNGTATNKPKQQQQLTPTTTTISNIKLPILKEEYDIWAMEMCNNRDLS
ncbi:hypothetical protein Tco_0618876, partial [Tanacetum coccineum]